MNIDHQDQSSAYLLSFLALVSTGLLQTELLIVKILQYLDVPPAIQLPTFLESRGSLHLNRHSTHQVARTNVCLVQCPTLAMMRPRRPTLTLLHTTHAHKMAQARGQEAQRRPQRVDHVLRP